MSTKKGNKYKLFGILCDIAAKGERCPFNDELRNKYGIPFSVTPAMLADDGLVRVEVYSKNYRVVEILSGPLKGKRTREPNHDRPPYKIIAPGDRVPLERKQKLVSINDIPI